MSRWIQIRVVPGEEPPAAVGEAMPAVVPDEEPSLVAQSTASATSSSGASRLLAVGGGLVVLGLVVAVVWLFRLRSGDQPVTAAVVPRPGEAVPMPAGQLATQVAPGTANQVPLGNAAAVEDASAAPPSDEVARRLASDRRVAIVNGEPITEAMLEREVGIGRVLYPLLRGIPVGNDAQTLGRMRSDLLSSLIDERLLVQAAKKAGITVSGADLDTRIDRMLGRVGLSAEDLASQLLAVGVSMNDLRASLQFTMLAERFVTENPPPSDVSAQSDYAAWVKVLQKQGEIQILAGDSATKTVKIGQPAPNFTLRSPKGETVHLSDFAGHPLLLNFWATWCPPCRFEMPLFEQTYQKLKDDGFVVLAVNVQEGSELVNPYIEQMGLTFPVALDRGGSVANAYRVSALPTTVFVDSNGIVTDIHRGALVESRLQGYLNNILGAGDE